MSPAIRPPARRSFRSMASYVALSVLASLAPVVADLALQPKPAAATTGYIYTIAGTGTAGYSGDGGPATSAQLNLSLGSYLAVDIAGNVFFSTSDYRVRKISAAGIITTVAGTGTYGFSGDGGPATAAQLWNPYDVVVDTAGNLYIADSANHRVRKVDAATGIITTLVGDNINTGWNPYGLALDGMGSLYASVGTQIYKVNLGTGTKTLVANTPNSCGDVEFVAPSYLYAKWCGVSPPYVVTRVDLTTGTKTTYAGTGVAGYSGDGGSATSARIDPTGLAVDRSGNLFIADNSYFVRKVDASTGTITKVAGCCSFSGYSGDGGPATSAKLFQTSDVAVAPNGDVIVIDSGNKRIRKIENIATGGPIGGAVASSEMRGGSNPAVCTTGNCVQRSVAQPINTAEGNFWHTFSDLAIPGRGVPLASQRTYNSNAASEDGPFGYGWTFNYNLSLSISGSTYTVKQENGSQVAFTLSGSTFTPTTPRVQATLVQNGDGTYTFTRKKDEIFNFNSSGQLTALKDLNNYTTTITRPSSTSLVATDPASRTLSFTLSGSHITGVTDPAGRTMSFTYDGSGNLTDVIDVGGGHSVFTYDGSHRMLTMRSPRFYGDTTTTPTPVTTNHYDGSGRIDWQSDELGQTTSFDYTTVPGSTKVTDPKGNATLYTYQYGTLVSETRGYGTSSAATWSYLYDPATLGVTSVTDPNGKVSSAYYDASGNKLLSIDALGNKTSYTYNSLNEPLTVKNALGQTTTMTYNSAGNPLTVTRVLTSVTPNENEVTTYTYDSSHAGDVLSVTDPLSHATTFTYNSTSGDLTSVTDAVGNKTTYSYNSPTSIGRVVSSVSPRGNVTGGNPATYTTTYEYDDFGHVTTIKDPLWTSSDATKHRQVRAFNTNGNLTSITDGNNQATTYTYDAAGQLTSANRPNSTSLVNEYWTDGTLKTQKDGNNQATSYAYDPLARLTSVTDPLSRVTSFTYDGAGNTLTKTDQGGTCATTPGTGCTRYTYNAGNLLTGITYSDGTTPNVSFGYDVLGRRTSMTDGIGTSSYVYDSLGRLTSHTNGASTAVAFGYDRADRQTSITYPASHTVTRAFDNANRLTSVTDWNSNATSFGWDEDSNLATITYPNGVVSSTTFDAASQLMAVSHTKSPSTLANFTYTRDGAGLLASVTSTGVGSNESYSHDQLSRVTAVDSNSYGYDSADNLTSLPGATQAFDNGNQLSSVTVGGVSTSFSYDTRGNRTAKTPTGGTATSYGYDQANRLTSVSGAASATYAYDGDGLRASKTTGGSTKAMVWDMSGGLPLLLSDGTSSFVYGPQGQPIAQIGSDGTTTHYIQHDQLGSTRLLTDSTGATAATYTYDAYGNTTTKTGTVDTPLQYAGQYTDAETGLQYLRARYYDPSTAQFLTRDPLVSLTHSAYGYAANNPLSYTDPSGLIVPVIIAGVLLVAAVAPTVVLFATAIHGFYKQPPIQPGAACPLATTQTVRQTVSQPRPQPVPDAWDRAQIEAFRQFTGEVRPDDEFLRGATGIADYYSYRSSPYNGARLPVARR